MEVEGYGTWDHRLHSLTLLTHTHYPPAVLQAAQAASSPELYGHTWKKAGIDFAVVLSQVGVDALSWDSCSFAA